MTEQRANNQPTLIWLSAIPQEQAIPDARQGQVGMRIFEDARWSKLSDAVLADFLVR
jgi:hypothetical protein